MKCKRCQIAEAWTVEPGDKCIACRYVEKSEMVLELKREHCLEMHFIKAKLSNLHFMYDGLKSDLRQLTEVLREWLAAEDRFYENAAKASLDDWYPGYGDDDWDRVERAQKAARDFLGKVQSKPLTTP